MDMLQGTIERVEVVHRKNFTALDGRRRCARIVVWAVMTSGERVWVRTVEGGLDPINIGIKVAMAQEFFKKLTGHEIRFREQKSGGEAAFFADEKSLPKKFLFSYREIKESLWHWVEANYAEELENLRKARTTKAIATRRANAGAREAESKRFAAQQQRELETRCQNALRLNFVKGRNPKHGNDQWEARHNGLRYVLRRKDAYDPSEGKISVEEIFHLVPDRVVLVSRIR